MVYQLNLLPRYRIYNTFLISLLELFRGTTNKAKAYRESIDVELEE
jgi:hypothetical protein